MSQAFVLFLVFLVLKLNHVIAWSWWWVTCPLWAGLTLGVVVLLLACLCGGMAAGGWTLGKKLRGKK